jgi:Family of unknown function (DUF6325)
MTAPVEYVIISFPGNRFSGEIMPALTELVESGTIRIVDLVFIKKDADGDITAFELDALEEGGELGLEELEGEAGDLLSEQDLELAAEMLEPDSSAALLVWEQVWAERIADAIRDSGGLLVAGERIPQDIVDAARAASTS